MVHDEGQIVGVGIKDGHFLALHLQRVGVPAGDEHVTAVHGVLENIDQCESLGNEVHRRHQREHGCVTLVGLQTLH